MEAFRNARSAQLDASRIRDPQQFNLRPSKPTIRGSSSGLSGAMNSNPFVLPSTESTAYTPSAGHAAVTNAYQQHLPSSSATSLPTQQTRTKAPDSNVFMQPHKEGNSTSNVSSNIPSARLRHGSNQRSDHEPTDESVACHRSVEADTATIPRTVSSQASALNNQLVERMRSTSLLSNAFEFRPQQAQRHRHPNRVTPSNSKRPRPALRIVPTEYQGRRITIPSQYDGPTRFLTVTQDTMPDEGNTYPQGVLYGVLNWSDSPLLCVMEGSFTARDLAHLHVRNQIFQNADGKYVNINGIGIKYRDFLHDGCEQPKCETCNTTVQPVNSWWRTADEKGYLCDPCGRYLRKHGSPRPSALWDKVVHARHINRKRLPGYVPKPDSRATAQREREKDIKWPKLKKDPYRECVTCGEGNVKPGTWKRDAERQYHCGECYDLLCRRGVFPFPQGAPYPRLLWPITNHMRYLLSTGGI